MKAGDLDDAVPPEPDAVLLEQVHARSVSFRKRRRAQRFGSVTSVTLVLVLALVGAVALARGDNSDGTRVISRPPGPITTLPSEVTAAKLLGEWRPVSIAGYTGPLTSPPLSQPPRIRFTTSDKWEGSDGCNGQGGSYELGPNGAIDFGEHFSEAKLCVNQTTPPQSLDAATRVEIRAGRLTFFGRDGAELARFARTGVTARVVLSSTTMTAGSQMKAHVVVENNTSRTVHVGGCGSIFAVILSSAKVNQGGPVWTQCLEDIAIPVGSTTYPVLVFAGYYDCSTTASPAMPSCLPGNQPPPLPPGVYRATLAQSTTVAPTPPAIDVTVVPSP